MLIVIVMAIGDDDDDDGRSVRVSLVVAAAVVVTAHGRGEHAWRHLSHSRRLGAGPHQCYAAQPCLGRLCRCLLPPSPHPLSVSLPKPGSTSDSETPQCPDPLTMGVHSTRITNFVMINKGTTTGALSRPAKA